MIENYQQVLSHCGIAAELAATNALRACLDDCSEEVLKDLLGEVSGGYLFEDEFALSRIVRDELELRAARRLLSEKE
jgi:hypothetical protein